MMVNSLWPMAISEKKKQQFRLKWKAQPWQNLLSRLVVIGWTFHTRGVLMLRCLTVITKGFRLCVACSAPVICHKHTTLTKHHYFFFSWGQINQVSSNRFFILKKGNKKRGHKGRLGPLCKLNTSRLSLAKKKKKKKNLKNKAKKKPPTKNTEPTQSGT